LTSETRNLIFNFLGVVQFKVQGGDGIKWDGMGWDGMGWGEKNF